MKNIEIVSKVVSREGEALVSPSKGVSTGNLSDYLLKSIWNKVFEIRTDSQGTEYIFGKVPVVTQYGITMYSGDGVDIPSLASGLPFDGRTIWYNPDTQQIEVIGGGSGGGGTADSVAWANITGKPTWIGSSKPTYSYSEITGAISTTELQNYLTQNSYLNVTSGDNRYLKLSGGTLTNTLTIDNSNVGLILHRSGQSTPYIRFGQDANNEWGELGVYNDGRLVFWPLVSSQGGYNQWNTVWHSGNDGSGSGLDADLLDGQQGSWYQQNVLGFSRYNYTSNTASEHDANAVTNGMLYNYGSPSYWKNAPSGLSYGQILSLSSANDTALMGQLAWDINHNSTSDTTNTLWWRGIQGKDRMSYAKWHQIAFTDSNVASATKLQTTRTIWGQSFDGSGNVDGNMIVKGQYVGITLQGTNSYNTGITFNDYEGNPRWDLSYRGLNAADKDFYIYRYTDDNSYHVAMSFIRSNGNVGIGTPTPERNLVVSNSGAEGLELSWDSTYGSILTYNRSTKQFLPFSISASVVNIGVTGVTCNLLVTGGITMYSDQRKKTILNHVELSLKQIADAPLIEHYYNSDEKKTTHVGSIAQYWASMNDWFCKLDGEGFYTMEIQNAALASAISIARELVKFENETDKRIRLLEEENKELRNEVERLKCA